MASYWHWWKGGLALALVSTLAIALIKPIGVSTQYVILDGILWNLVADDLIVQAGPTEAPRYDSSNPYLAKSGGKYAQAVAEPVNYGLVFVLSMAAGAFIAARTAASRPAPEDRQAPQVWRAAYGAHAQGRRLVTAFVGGVLVLYGARLAGGCTSGHMISGMVQTSVSGYLFAAAVFATAIPCALWFYRKAA